ncbi:GntR family transcriptional regulator [bacterium]|nr:GntR family transcriptional regulator [bacterium]
MTESAALELRKAILGGVYPPGTHLVPAVLEEDLQLSRTAIREAIRELVGTGLADSTTHKGACVADPLGIEEIREIFEIRYQLEGKAALLGTRQISADGITEMEGLLEEMSGPRKGDRYLDFLLNQQFHVVLYRASGWKYLVKVIDRMFDQVLAFRSSLYHRFTEAEFEATVNWETFKPYHQDHIRILEVVKARDPEGARAAVVDNLKRGLDGLEKMLVFLEQRLT